VIRQEYQGERCDLLVALHALRSFPSINRYRILYPNGPLVLALTGTDLYGFIHTDARARKALKLATRLVILQPLGVNQVPQGLRDKVRVIHQSVPAMRVRSAPHTDRFEVCVLAHLRPVKDPFRTALAARLLPSSSRIRVLQVGSPLSKAMAKRAFKEALVNPRFRWLGELPRWKALRVLARCRLLVVTSKLEGGANVISEALAASVPVLSSRIDGSVGLLGKSYPGYFPVGDTEALAALLQRAEQDADYYQRLCDDCTRLHAMVDPKNESQRWKALLKEIALL
jgi:putative glycosyltransferase (TIGR04348 family)